MNVYVVQYCEYDFFYIVGVYSTMALAEAARDKHINDTNCSEYYRVGYSIQIYEVDK